MGFGIWGSGFGVLGLGFGPVLYVKKKSQVSPGRTRLAHCRASGAEMARGSIAPWVDRCEQVTSGVASYISTIFWTRPKYCDEHVLYVYTFL